MVWAKRERSNGRAKGKKDASDYPAQPALAGAAASAFARATDLVTNAWLPWLLCRQRAGDSP
jgi:hypothetical protein